MEPLSSSGHTPSLVYWASSSQSSIIVSLFYFQLFILAEVGRKMAELQPRHKVMLLLKYFTGSWDHCSAEIVFFFASSSFLVSRVINDMYVYIYIYIYVLVWTFPTSVCYDHISAFASPTMCFPDPFGLMRDCLHTHTHAHGLAIALHIDSPQRLNVTASPKIDLSARLDKSPHYTDCSALWTSNTSQSWAIRLSQMVSVANTGTWTLVAG